MTDGPCARQRTVLRLPRPRIRLILLGGSHEISEIPAARFALLDLNDCIH